MRIDNVLAQKISDKVMTVIPYNVNIMNEEGLIIGSGEKERINTYHEGAINSIEQSRMITIYKTDHSSKPGVNIPIYFRNRIIGVIGISGDPKIVGSFAELVRVTAELLINQEFLFYERRIKEQMKEEFLYQWVFRQDDYDESFTSNAETFGIVLNIPRMAIIVKRKQVREMTLTDQEYSLRYNQHMVLYIVPENSDFIRRLEASNLAKGTLVGIGGSYTHLAKSIQEAQRAIEIADKMGLSIIYCYYNEVQFIDYLTNRDGDLHHIVTIIEKMNNSTKGKELIETLLSYVKHNGDMNEIAADLHIHRNSLSYRLQKIETLTEKNPKHFIELFELFTGYILYKFLSDSGNTSD
ncbi:CdaR family transcriptional regulator [Bacillus mesophilum]|uniref:Sugar diacid recognition protein n=1 Tax=Bacillus mesophilum TaxID=1071718 RepID=A0A7V7RQP8_9BACI|nr:sugar diacid recognition domain-containing protein [Bacillus mesophilum]KAB2335806.1 sugar diacid recognition protein [Bacillus mesophilum]